MSKPRYRYERHFARNAAGSNPPTVVFLPGLFAGGWIWDPAWQALAEKTDYDLLRFSDSLLGLELKVTEVGTWRNWLKEFLDGLSIDRPILVGNSLGGLMVLDFAANFPDRIHAGVASGAPGASKMATIPLDQVQSGWLTKADAHRLAAHLFYDPSKVSEEAIDRTYKEVASLKRMRACIQSLRVAKDYELAPMLPRIKCPLMMLWGDHDRVTPLDDWLPLLDKIPNCRLKVVEACGHSPMVEKPEEFSNILLEFLREAVPQETRSAV